jgi:hypothetical protein
MRIQVRNLPELRLNTYLHVRERQNLWMPSIMSATKKLTISFYLKMIFSILYDAVFNTK